MSYLSLWEDHILQISENKSLKKIFGLKDNLGRLIRSRVGNLLITEGRIGYSYLYRGPQRKLIMSWTVSETVFL
jgi:hypothetical protein